MRLTEQFTDPPSDRAGIGDRSACSASPMAVASRGYQHVRSSSYGRREGFAIGTPWARTHRRAHRPLRVAPALVAGTPGESRNGVRRADGEAVCPPDGLSGSLGRDGTTDIPSRQQLRGLIPTVAAQVWQKAQGGRIRAQSAAIGSQIGSQLALTIARARRNVPGTLEKLEPALGLEPRTC
jgi:hypothetical protein